MTCRFQSFGIGRRLAIFLVAAVVTVFSLASLFFIPFTLYKFVLGITLVVWSATLLPDPDGIYRVPLQMCPRCLQDCRSEQAMKEALRTVPEYAAILDRYPGTRVRLEVNAT